MVGLLCFLFYKTPDNIATFLYSYRIKIHWKPRLNSKHVWLYEHISHYMTLTVEVNVIVNMITNYCCLYLNMKVIAMTIENKTSTIFDKDMFNMPKMLKGIIDSRAVTPRIVFNCDVCVCILSLSSLRDLYRGPFIRGWIKLQVPFTTVITFTNTIITCLVGITYSLERIGITIVQMLFMCLKLPLT